MSSDVGTPVPLFLAEHNVVVVAAAHPDAQQQQQQQQQPGQPVHPVMVVGLLHLHHHPSGSVATITMLVGTVVAVEFSHHRLEDEEHRLEDDHDDHRHAHSAAVRSSLSFD